MNAAPTCYCGLPMFPDDGEWLCPARFDGAHSNVRSRTFEEKQTQLSKTRTIAGAAGGNVRAQNLTAYQRRKIAQQAAKARWNSRREK